jgi:hypothetical protein
MFYMYLVCCRRLGFKVRIVSYKNVFGEETDREEI